MIFLKTARIVLSINTPYVRLLTLDSLMMKIVELPTHTEDLEVEITKILSVKETTLQS